MCGEHARAFASSLLPVLERDFSGAIVDHLGELAVRLAREEGNFWDAPVEDRFQVLVADEDGIRVALDALLAPLEGVVGQCSKASLSLKYNEFGPLRVLTERLIRCLYEGVRGEPARALGANHVEQAVQLASGSSSGHHVELPGEIIVRRISAN